MTDTNYENYAQTVARLAAGYKKSNKVNAFKSLASVLERVSEKPDVIDDSGQILKDLADLYAFFLPPAPAKPKTAWDWVAKAMAKDDVCHYLNWVYVTPDHITATDGHRLHRAPNTDNLAPGYYDKAGTRCHGPDYATYPEVERVIPRNAPHTLDLDSAVPEATPRDTGRTRYALSNGEDGLWDVRYMRDAVSLGAPSQVAIAAPASPARFDFEDGRIAVVMGMKRD